MAERLYDVAVSTGDGFNKQWRQLDPMTWAEYVAWLDLEHPADEKHCGAFVAGRLTGRERSKETVLSRSMLTLDADAPRPDFRERVAGLGVMALAYSTFGHRLNDGGKYDGGPRWRLVIPLDRDVTPDEYWRLAQTVVRRVGRGFDPQTAEWERLMYRPSGHSGAALFEHWEAS